MDAKLKEKWVKALRSGKYVQGKYNLFNGYGYCCLGVLCVVQGKQLDELQKELGTLSLGATLPRTLSAGLSDEEKVDLVEMNDSGKPFPEIAKYIEEHL